MLKSDKKVRFADLHGNVHNEDDAAHLPRKLLPGLGWVVEKPLLG